MPDRLHSRRHVPRPNEAVGVEARHGTLLVRLLGHDGVLADRLQVAPHTLCRRQGQSVRRDEGRRAVWEAKDASPQMRGPDAVHRHAVALLEAVDRRRDEAPAPPRVRRLRLDRVARHRRPEPGRAPILRLRAPLHPDDRQTREPDEKEKKTAERHGPEQRETTVRKCDVNGESVQSVPVADPEEPRSGVTISLSGDTPPGLLPSCESGGIGRRASLRSSWGLAPWGFESPLSHDLRPALARR